MTLLTNWLWQGTLLALIAVALLGASKRLSAANRYRGLWIVMGALVALPLASLFLAALPWGTATVVETASPAVPVTNQIDAPAADAWLSLPSLPSWLPLVVLVAWAGWFAWSMWRLGHAITTLRVLRASASPFPAGREERLTRWCRRGPGRSARLVLSDRVGAVSMLGLGTPLIAVAPDVLDGLDDDALDRIVIHEWAHVQRRDDYGRLAQALVMAVIGLHPGARLIATRLDLEREAACDDVAAGQDGRAVARALTMLAALPRSRPHAIAAAALSGSVLLTRVTRLVDPSRSRSAHGGRVAWAVAVPCVTVLVALAGALPALATASREADGAFPNVAPRTAAPSSMSIPAQAEQDSRAKTPEASPIQVTPSGEPSPDLVRSAQDVPAPAAATSPERLPSPVPERPARTFPVAADGLPGKMHGTSRSEIPAASPLTLERAAGRDWTLPALPAPAAGAAPAAASSATTADTDATPWEAAADAGVAIGRGGRKAGTATGRFFTGMARKIAGSF